MIGTPENRTPSFGKRRLVVIAMSRDLRSRSFSLALLFCWLLRSQLVFTVAPGTSPKAAGKWRQGGAVRVRAAGDAEASEALWEGLSPKP